VLATKQMQRRCIVCTVHFCMNNANLFLNVMTAGTYVVNQARSLGEAQRRTMCILLIACNLLWSKSFTPERLAMTCRLVIEAVARVQRDLPLTEMDIKLHNLMHLVQKITVSGPLWVTSMFCYEGMWRRFGLWGTNKTYVEATMLRKYSDFEYMCWRYMEHPEVFSADISSRYPLLGSSIVRPFWFAEAGMNDMVEVQVHGAEHVRDLMRRHGGQRSHSMRLDLLLHYDRYE
jgi:hypothetical protein